MKPRAAGVRTAVQAGVAFVASGAIVELFNIIVDGVTIDPTLQMSLAFVLTWIVSYAQNQYEDAGNHVPLLTKLKTDEEQGT